MVKREIAVRLLSNDTEKVSLLARDSFLYRMGYKLLTQWLIDNKYPIHIYLELSRSCNYSCQMCARNKIEDKSGFMRADTLLKVLKEMKPYPTSYALHMFGEPLLHPLYYDMIRSIRVVNKQNNIILVTNGSMDMRDLAGLVDRIYVSVPHMVPGMYYKMTGGGDLSNVHKNVIEFIKMNTKTKLLVRYFGPDITEVLSWKKEGVQFEFKEFHNYAGAAKEWTNLKSKGNVYPCYHHFYTLAITYDGDIRICCADWTGDTSLGKVKDTTIQEAWKKGLGKHFDLCDKCDIWQYKTNMFFKWQH